MNVFKSKNPTPLELKIIFIGLFVCLGLFMSALFYQIFFADDITLKKSDAIDLKITKVKTYRGFITLNDSVVISGNLPRINIDTIVNRYSVLGNIRAPFHISKSVNNDTIIIVKGNEILIYKLFPESKSRWSW